MTGMAGYATWDLFEDLRDAQEELLRINRMRVQPFSQLGQRYDPGPGTPPWAPAVDISESKDAYLVTAELPGVGLDDLEITFEAGLLTIQGQRHTAHDASEERIHRAERRYGAFRRSITLPTHVKLDAIEASANDGVLQIMVPKADEVHAKRIQVRTGPDHSLPTAAVQRETTRNNKPKSIVAG